MKVFFNKFQNPLKVNSSRGFFYKPPSKNLKIVYLKKFMI